MRRNEIKLLPISKKTLDGTERVYLSLFILALGVVPRNVHLRRAQRLLQARVRLHGVALWELMTLLHLHNAIGRFVRQF